MTDRMVRKRGGDTKESVRQTVISMDDVLNLRIDLETMSVELFWVRYFDVDEERQPE